MYFTYWQGQNGLWYWNLKAANHERIAYGEGYNDKRDVLHVIDLVKGSGSAPVRPA